jgi:hypothetical protein
VINPRKMRCAGHVAIMGEGRGVYKFWWENLRERNNWGDPDVDGKIVLRQILRKLDVEVWTGMSWLKIETSTGHL